MRVLLFLGSGVSKMSGVPLVDDLTDEILNGELVLNDTEFLHSPSVVPSSWDRKQYLAEVAFPFLQLLADKLNRHRKVISRDRFRESNPVNYEDLFSICHRLGSGRETSVDGFIGCPFLPSLQSDLDIAGIQLNGNLTFSSEMSILAICCQDIIRFVVWTELRKPREPKGLDAIAELALDRDVSELNIVSLNHDSLVESLLESRDLDFSDGFGPPEDGIRYFNRDFLQRSTRVSILKLHGSWNLVQIHFQIQKYKSHRLGLQVGEHGKYRFDHLDRHLEPCFLIGEELKAMDYWTSIYRDFFVLFDELLEETDTLVVS